MFTGIPNMAWVFGYFRASWTLRADLSADFVCRLLAEMDEREAPRWSSPQLRPEDEDMELRPWVDPDNFNPGYLTRSMHLMPKQGDHQPWLHTPGLLDRQGPPAIGRPRRRRPRLRLTLPPAGRGEVP